MAEDILFLIEQLSINKAHLLGISMGGQIAQLFASLLMKYYNVFLTLQIETPQSH